MRLWKKQIKSAKEERWIDLGREVGSTVAQELIRGGSEIVSSGLRAAGQIGRGIAENPDPISQGVAVGGGVLLLGWFLSAHGDIASFFGLDTLFPFIKGGGHPPDISKIQAEASADLVDWNASFPNLPNAPGWLVQMAAAKNLQQEPNLDLIMNVAQEPILFRQQFLADFTTAVTGGGEGLLVQDIHKLYLDWKANQILPPILPGAGPGNIGGR